jgi:hypothetical protein
MDAEASTDPGAAAETETGQSVAGPAPVPPIDVTGWRKGVLNVARWIKPYGEPANVIYGTLIAAAVLATKVDDAESGADVLASCLIVLAIYWLAHVYAHVIADRLETDVRPGWRDIVQAAFRDWGMLRGALVPIVMFGVLNFLGVSVNASGLTALWATVFLLGCWGLVAAIRAGARGFELIAETLMAASLGVLVVVLKVFIH